MMLQVVDAIYLKLNRRTGEQKIRRADEQMNRRTVEQASR